MSEAEQPFEENITESSETVIFLDAGTTHGYPPDGPPE
jgi:hypothetical protein